MTPFHTQTLARLGIAGEPDPLAMAALELRAEALGIRFPASFVAWFGMHNGMELLRKHSNCDAPVALEDLGAPISWAWGKKRDWLHESNHLVFMCENQDVCAWALALDGSDDPPVVVSADPDGEASVRPNEVRGTDEAKLKAPWLPCAPSFSTFVACQVWDHTAIWVEPTFNETDPILLQAQATPLTERDLAFLRERFDEGPTTSGWPGTQYRFSRAGGPPSTGAGGRLLLTATPDQTDWWFTADDEATLTALAQELWDCADLRTSAWSNDPRGEELLERLRA